MTSSSCQPWQPERPRPTPRMPRRTRGSYTTAWDTISERRCWTATPYGPFASVRAGAMDGLFAAFEGELHRCDDDVDHPFHGSGGPSRFREQFDFLRAFARLEQPEVNVVGIPSPDVELRSRLTVIPLNQALVVREGWLVTSVQSQSHVRGDPLKARHQARSNAINLMECRWRIASNGLLLKTVSTSISATTAIRARPRRRCSAMVGSLETLAISASSRKDWRRHPGAGAGQRARLHRDGSV